MDDDPPHGFNQTFVLKPLGDSFFVQHDMFRLALHHIAVWGEKGTSLGGSGRGETCGGMARGMWWCYVSLFPPPPLLPSLAFAALLCKVLLVFLECCFCQVNIDAWSCIHSLGLFLLHASAVVYIITGWFYSFLPSTNSMKYWTRPEMLYFFTSLNSFFFFVYIFW